MAEVCLVSDSWSACSSSRYLRIVMDVIGFFFVDEDMSQEIMERVCGKSARLLRSRMHFIRSHEMSPMS